MATPARRVTPRWTRTRCCWRLIRNVGFAPVDAGPLQVARYTEPFALLVARLAYEGKGGPKLAYRFEPIR
jgi:predicted dinucleotide-binding enzyme